MKRAIVFAAALAGVSTHALGVDLTIPSMLAGGYSADGTFANSPAFQNYRVGHSPVTTVAERRNFFNFDLTAYAPMAPGTIIGGSLKLYVPHFAPGITIDPGDGYISPDPFEVYRVTSTPFTALDLADPTNTAAEALAIYGTLGTGSLVGEVAVSAADMGTYLDIPLTAPALIAINSMMGMAVVPMGGRLTSLSFIPPDELVFGFTDSVAPHMAGKEPKLVLTMVPGPGVGVVLAGAGLFAARRRRS